MGEDRYRSFAELAAGEREGFDYQKRSHRRDSRVAIAAPHGGKIEPGTSEIAEAIADERFSFYAFEGIRRARNSDLHLTSRKFDEPECLELLESCGLVVAVHGLSDAGEFVAVGGANTTLREAIVDVLAGAGFSARLDDDPSHCGTDPDNLCNRRGPGVQLEISKALREKLKEGSDALDRFAAAVQVALVDYQERADAAGHR